MTTLSALADAALPLIRVAIQGEPVDGVSAATALAELLDLVEELPEYGGGRFMTDVDTAISRTAGEDERILCSVGGLTITLPKTPSDGARVSVVDVDGLFGASNVTLARNGRKVEGLAANKAVTATGTWIYRADQSDWVAVTSLTGASECPYPAALHGALKRILCRRMADNFGRDLTESMAQQVEEARSLVRARYKRIRSNNPCLNMPGALNSNIWGRR